MIDYSKLKGVLVCRSCKTHVMAGAIDVVVATTLLSGDFICEHCVKAQMAKEEGRGA